MAANQIKPMSIYSFHIYLFICFNPNVKCDVNILNNSNHLYNQCYTHVWCTWLHAAVVFFHSDLLSCNSILYIHICSLRTFIEKDWQFVWLWTSLANSFIYFRVQSDAETALSLAMWEKKCISFDDSSNKWVLNLKTPFVVKKLSCRLRQRLPGSCLVRKLRVGFEEVLSTEDDGSACSF